MLELLGGIFYVIALADFAGMFFGYDFTGQSWTPILFGLIGQFFIHISGSEDEENAGDESEENKR